MGLGDRGLRILGLDPGSQVTGYGLVDRCGGEVRHVAHGTLRPGRGGCPSGRLARIHEGVVEMVAQHEPDLAVVEQVHVGRNVRSALVLGQARGAVLAALGSAGLPVEEYTPGEIKRAVVGTGSADKAQVQEMVRRLLSLQAVPAQDAADALAAALCRAHRSQALAGASRSRPRLRRSGPRVVRRAP